MADESKVSKVDKVKWVIAGGEEEEDIKKYILHCYFVDEKGKPVKDANLWLVNEKTGERKEEKSGDLGGVELVIKVPKGKKEIFTLMFPGTNLETERVKLGGSRKIKNNLTAYAVWFGTLLLVVMTLASLHPARFQPDSFWIILNWAAAGVIVSLLVIPLCFWDECVRGIEGFRRERSGQQDLPDEEKKEGAESKKKKLSAWRLFLGYIGDEILAMALYPYLPSIKRRK